MKWPREYFRDYALADTREKQRIALSGCPKEFQEMIRTYIKISRMRNNFR